jgi:hypothetical protein
MQIPCSRTSNQAFIKFQELFRYKRVKGDPPWTEENFSLSLWQEQDAQWLALLASPFS